MRASEIFPHFSLEKTSKDSAKFLINKNDNEQCDILLPPKYYIYSIIDLRLLSVTWLCSMTFSDFNVHRSSSKSLSHQAQPQFFQKVQISWK